MKFSKKFVCATTEYNTYEQHVSNPQFRKSFFLSELPHQAEITICGLGYYELYVNGQTITKGYMAPYRANPDHYLYYDHYDLIEYLTSGENVIGILLGNGILNANVECWDFRNASFRSSPKVALSLEIDGKELFDATDLKCTESPILFDEFHSGEYYDARLEIEGWKVADFDDRSWRHVLVAQCPKGEPRIPDCEPIGIVDVHYPARIIKSKNGYIYDFVVNTAGLCELNIKGTEGQEVSLRYGELLRDGELDTANISYNEFMNRDRYILKGDSTEKFMPHFTYHGFRFVEVTGITEKQATNDLLTFYEMSSSFEKTADFQCDNASLNALFDAAIRSDRANFMYFPTDCPQREKNGWTGDAAFSAEQHLIYFNCATSMKEWLRNIFKAQNDEGAIPGIIPTYQWGFHWGNGPAWDMVMFELPYRILQYTGDTEIIREGRNHLLRYLRYMETKRDENGLLHYGLGDWCHSSRSQRELSTQLPYTDTITCKRICDKAAVLFDAIDDTESAKYARGLSKDIKESFRTHCMRVYKLYQSTNPADSKNALKIANQTTQSMAIYYGMLEDEELSDAYQALEKIIHASADRMEFGMLGNRAIFRVLAENGKIDLALKMILNPIFPSFQYWLNQGATSLFEDFHYFDHRIDEFSIHESLPNSLNHHFTGDFIALFMRHLAGIQVESPTQITLAPCFTDRLNNLSAYETINGKKISVTYKKIDIMIDMTITVPNGVDVTVVVPNGYQLSFGKTNCKTGENHLIFCKK
jgi:alpha-L-rhamnosidase